MLNNYKLDVIFSFLVDIWKLCLGHQGKIHSILKCLLLITAILFVNALIGQEKISIIPQPQDVHIQKGNFLIKKNTKIVIGAADRAIASMLQAYLQDHTGYSLKVVETAKRLKNTVSFHLNKSLEKEAYQLRVSKKNIQITASNNKGWFYGMQSFRQLIPERGAKIKDINIPAAEIKDQPRFGWRAYMLDDSRYFHGEAFVKMILDQMALLKMNVFHWHLVDDAGWRIEIKKYPKLTSVGGYRKDTQVGPEKWKSKKLAGVPHGGFYTQKQIKDIVAYAAKRQITIVPEIEMPGHASASIAAYPWLGTEKRQIEVPVTFGRKRDIYDVSNPKVIEFIQNVLLEVFELFPSNVVHIGGDEVNFAAWREAPHVQQYMKEKKLKTPPDLQIYFTNNISKFIEDRGRRMMGWNEIIGINIHPDHEEKKDDEAAETELAKNVIIHFWKGDLSLITQAAKKGYSIVNSLHSATYLDYNYESISLKKAYDFDPVPTGLDERYHNNIYGLGCQMWSEWTPTNKDVEYQTFPRIAAYAAVGWTQKERKNYTHFSTALKILQKGWTVQGINFAKEID